MWFIKTIFASLTSILLFSSASLSQDNNTKIEFNLFSANGVVVGVPMSFGAKFSAEHNIAVPASFGFTIPTDRTKNIKVLPKPGGDAIYKVSFASADNKLRSNLQFVPFTLKDGPENERMNALAGLAKMAFRFAVINPDKADINVVRPTKIRSYQAVEAIGRYDDGQGSIVALRVVAVIKASSNKGLFGVIHALPETTGMKEVGDILLTDGSRALGTLKFK